MGWGWNEIDVDEGQRWGWIWDEDGKCVAWVVINTVSVMSPMLLGAISCRAAGVQGPRCCVTKCVQRGREAHSSG